MSMQTFVWCISVDQYASGSPGHIKTKLKKKAIPQAAIVPSMKIEHI